MVLHEQQIINLKTFNNELSEIHPNPIYEKMFEYVEKAKNQNLDLFQKEDYIQYIKSFIGDKGLSNTLEICFMISNIRNLLN